mgnify:CR=1 FL=1
MLNNQCKLKGLYVRPAFTPQNIAQFQEEQSPRGNMLAHKRGGKDAGLSIDGQEERPMLGHEHSNRIMPEDDTEMQADKKYKRRPTSMYESTLHLLRQYHQRHGTVRMLSIATLICVLLSIVIYFCYFYSLGRIISFHLQQV